MLIQSKGLCGSFDVSLFLGYRVDKKLSKLAFLFVFVVCCLSGGSRNDPWTELNDILSGIL